MATSDDDKIIEEALDAFEAVEEAESDNRARMMEDLRFGRLGEQWEQDDLDQRATDGRPSLVINRMPVLIRQVVNDARQNKPSIKTHPIDDKADPETAEILNGIIRNIEVQSKADLAFDTAVDNAVTCGIGYIRVDVDYSRDDTFDKDILINRVVNPFTVYGDPMSNAADSSDWNTAFITELLKHSEFERMYPDAEKVSWEGGEDQKERLWIQEDTVRLAEYWRRNEIQKLLYKLTDGTIMSQAVWDLPETQEAMYNAGISIEAEREVPGYEVEQFLMTGTEILEKTKWAGKYIPIIPMYGEEVNVEGERFFFSLIHSAKDAQRMFNYWRSATTELVALAPKAPWIGPAGFADSDPRWATANTESFSYLEYDGQIPPQRQPFAGVPAGALQESLNASDDIKATTGIFDAALGARSNETSGRAIMARQRESDVSTFHFLDNASRAIRHTGNVILDLIPHVYSEPRIMRIMGEDETPENIQINQAMPVPPTRAQPDPRDEEGNPLTKIYDLTVGKYDVTVKAGPSFTSRREEAAMQMTELIRSFPSAAPLIGDILAESLDWPRADEIAKRLKTMLPAGAAGDDDAEEPNPEADALKQQLEQGIQMFRQQTEELQGAHAKMAQIEMQLKAAQSDRQHQQMQAQTAAKKVEVDMFNAQTNRLAAEAEAQRDQADAQLKLEQAQQASYDKQLEVLEAVNAPIPGVLG
tara:strand:+ start:303 stop:2408 length:2106 start_codon:yes stop_codon:yes gene_type:complete